MCIISGTYLIQYLLKVQIMKQKIKTLNLVYKFHFVYKFYNYIYEICIINNSSDKRMNEI